MSLNVTDLIFVLDSKTHTVIPCKVIEKVTSESLEGEIVYHMVETPAGKNFRIEKCKHPWFSTIDDARDFLKTAAENLISETIQQAQAAAEDHFGESTKNENTLEDLNDMDAIQSVNENVKIDLGDGQIANVRLPDGLLDAENITN